MRILAVTPRVYLGDIYLNLRRDGHDVRIAATDLADQHAFGGILPVVSDWRAELDWVGREGLIVFEGVNRGAEQDALRQAGFRVIGGSAFGDRLEVDRAFGQRVLAELGLPVATAERFANPEEALRSLQRHPRPVVLKYDDGVHPTFVGQHAQGARRRFRFAPTHRGHARVADGAVERRGGGHRRVF